jgi:hypothetical protein
MAMSIVERPKGYFMMKVDYVLETDEDEEEDYEESS